MAKNQNSLAESVRADGSSGRSGGFLADENGFDSRALWRLGSWGVGSVGAVIVALLAYNSGAGLRPPQIVAAERAKPLSQLEIAGTAEKEIRRLSSAMDTLNGDRDRLFARVAALEQGFESVTGSISRNVARAGAATATASTPPDIDPDPPGGPDSSSSDASTTADASTDAPLSASAAFTTAAAATAVKSSVASSSSPVIPGTESSAAVATSITPEAAPQPALAVHNPPATMPRGQDETATLGAVKSEPEENLHRRKEAQIVVASIRPIADAPQPPSPAMASSSEADAGPREENVLNQKDKDGVSHSFTKAARDSVPVPAPRTDFGIDLGSASSIKNLRALWQSLLKSEAKQLASLHPIIVLKETNNGSGMQMRLVAGPLADAATAARICAVLTENGRTCETAVFDGQRLAMNKDSKDRDIIAPATKKPKSANVSRQRHSRKSTRAEEPSLPPPPPPPPPKPSMFGSFFSR